MRAHTIRGGGGLRLHAREWGPPDAPPVVLVHGISQNHQCWVRQYDGALADDFRLDRLRPPRPWDVGGAG